MERLFGLETEYGVQVEDDASFDVVDESMELVRAYDHREFVARWDYGVENPRLDLRGFEVAELRNDKDELQHLQSDRARQIPLAELKSDLALPNGARLYNDHTHPEYATPECLRLRDLVASDRAGERILQECARRRTQTRSRGRIRLFKNNTDFCGHSYGCHENYLVRRDLAFAAMVAGLVPFLVTRQVFTGAGKVGLERSPRSKDVAVFQVSQRAEFFETLTGVDTMHRRPLINTRDEPHADPERYRRLHVITGDANMAEHATALKVGSLALVLDLLDEGVLPAIQLEDPVGAFGAISSDPGRQWDVTLEGKRHSSALEIQQQLLDAARRYTAGRDAETDWVLQSWQEVLEGLGDDRQKLIGRVDWVTKKWLLESFAEAEGLDWEKPEHVAWLQSQDLEYHSIDPDSGLFLALEKAGTAPRLVPADRVLHAVGAPPGDTRAYFRGRCIERFGLAVRRLNWDRVELAFDGRVCTIELNGCLDPETVAKCNRTVDEAPTPAALVAALEALLRVGVANEHEAE